MYLNDELPFAAVVLWQGWNEKYCSTLCYFAGAHKEYLEAEPEHWGPCALTSDAQVSTMLFNSMKAWWHSGLSESVVAARGTQQLEGNPVRLGAKTESMRGKGNFLAWTRDPPLFMALHSVHISGRPMHRINLKPLFFIIPPRAKISSCLCPTRHQWQGGYGER